MENNTEELLRKNNAEKLFQEMARSYVEQYGMELRRENAALTDGGLIAPDRGGDIVGDVSLDSQNEIPDSRKEIPDSRNVIPGSRNEIPDSRNAVPDIRIASLDRKVRRRMDLRFLPQPLARVKPPAAIALAAACLVFALLTVLIPLSNRGGQRSANTGRQVAEVAATTLSREASYKSDNSGTKDGITAESDTGSDTEINEAVNTDRNTGTDGNGPASAQYAPSIQAQEQAPVATQFEQIALKKELPQEYAVAEVKQDGDKTIYHIESATLDDMIITLVKTSEDHARIAGQDAARAQAGFIKVDLLVTGRQALEAQALSKADYNLLAFRADGIDYELSCKYDINSLLTLGTYLI